MTLTSTSTSTSTSSSYKTKVTLQGIWFLKIPPNLCFSTTAKKEEKGEFHGIEPHNAIQKAIKLNSW